VKISYVYMFAEACDINVLVYSDVLMSCKSYVLNAFSR